MKFILLLLIFTGSISSCEQVVEDDQEITAQNLEKKLVEIRSMIDSYSCSETDQCRFLAYGSKSCGGPQGYLLFTNQIEMEALAQKVEEYNQAEDAYNKKFGIISDCMFVTPPEKLTCENGKCVQSE